MTKEIRSNDQNHRPTSTISLVACGLVGAVLASSVLVTGDSISITEGNTLPQVLLILVTTLVATIAGWQVIPIGSAAASRAASETQASSPSALPHKSSSHSPAGNFKSPSGQSGEGKAVGGGWVSDSKAEAGASALQGWRAGVLLFWAVIVCLLISSMAGTLRADGRAVWNNFWHMLALLLFAFTSARITQRVAVARALLQLIILCAVFQSTFALHQYFVSMPAARAEYLANPEASLAKAQIDAPAGSELRSQYESRLLGSFEPAGTFALTNSLAVLLSGVIIAMAVTLRPGRTGPATLTVWLARLLLLIIIVVWLLTKSRSGFLAVTIVGLAAIALSRFTRVTADKKTNAQIDGSAPGRFTWIMGGAALLILTCVSIWLLSSDQLVLSEAPKSILYRVEYWQATAKMIRDYPLTGVGMGNFQSYYPIYKLPAASEVIADPHNWLFDLAANCSLPLLIVAMCGLMIVLRNGLQLAQAREEDPQVPNRETDGIDAMHVKSIWMGAVASFCLIAFLQLLLSELIDFDATLLGLLAAIVSWLVLRTLKTPESTLRLSAWLAALTMLVCLLASGCWQAGGIALPLGACLAICSPLPKAMIVEPWKRRDRSGWIGVLLVMATLAGFVWQTWQPVQASWALEQQAISAWQQGRPEAAEAAINQAMAADPRALGPRRLLAQIRTEQAVAIGRRAAADEFAGALARVDSAIAELIASNPITHVNRVYAGECNLSLAAVCSSWNAGLAADRVTVALEHYDHARQRYPTNVATLGQLAALRAWLNSGQDQQSNTPATEALSEAFRYSEITPHANRKLSAQLIFLPVPLSDKFPAESIDRPTAGSPWVRAEPLCDFLRKMMGNTESAQTNKTNATNN